mgnify:CR=1 FL=1
MIGTLQSAYRFENSEKGPFFAVKGLTLLGRACGPGLSRQKREFEESGCSLLASAVGPRADIENVTRGTIKKGRRLIQFSNFLVSLTQLQLLRSFRTL